MITEMTDNLLLKRTITGNVIDQAMTWEEYYLLIRNLLTKGKTTGEGQKDEYLKYTRLNFQRMKRVHKTFSISEALLNTIEELEKGQIWLVITEGWCGDAAQSLPAIARIAELSDKIQLKILLRDEHPEIMDMYLTNGSRSIPKLIALDEKTLEELFTWGPRPEPMQQMVMEHRANPMETKEKFMESLHKKYTIDKTLTLQQELNTLLKALI